MWSSASRDDCSGVRRGSLGVVFLAGEAGEDEFLDDEAIGESLWVRVLGVERSKRQRE